MNRERCGLALGVKKENHEERSLGGGGKGRRFRWPMSALQTLCMTFGAAVVTALTCFRGFQQNNSIGFYLLNNDQSRTTVSTVQSIVIEDFPQEKIDRDPKYNPQLRPQIARTFRVNVSYGFPLRCWGGALEYSYCSTKLVATARWVVIHRTPNLYLPEQPTAKLRPFTAVKVIPKWPSAAPLAGNLVIYLLVLSACVELPRRLIRVRRKRLGRCTNCSYDLTGNTTGRCPECGAMTTARAASS